jgi:hypothetical protein
MGEKKIIFLLERNREAQRRSAPKVSHTLVVEPQSTVRASADDVATAFAVVVDVAIAGGAVLHGMTRGFEAVSAAGA